MKVYSMKVRNPLVAAVLVIAAIGALAMAFMVGVILLTTLAAAGALLGAGIIIRRKFSRARGDLPRSQSVSAQLDPALEVRPPEPRALPRSDPEREDQ
ncbi:MAG: hypothetical protein M3Z17_06610 [Gemmatimonadota bacterium]|nr:hypothetical protein [Gemmatimonadota bacterium]